MKFSFTGLVSSILILFVLGIITGCEDRTASLISNPPLEKGNSNPEDFDEAVDTVGIWIYTNNMVNISPELFGVNNDWVVITDDDYVTFEQALEGIGYELVRFPGGWESEWYDWGTNDTPGWSETPAEPGASIGTVKATNPPNLSIVVPTKTAMEEEQWSDEWYAEIQICKAQAVEAIASAGADNILAVEIGNEWWLQWGGGVPRAQKVKKYAHIAKRIAKHIKLEFPNADFKLLVNGDYTEPDEFTEINTVFGADLQYIDGLALHPYAGYDSATHHIDSVKSYTTSCKLNLGKDYVYFSEWTPSKAYNNGKVYAQSANVMVELFHEFARAGADAAAFWPPVNSSIPGVGLFNSTYSVQWPTGQLFADLSANYRGGALLTTTNGNIRAIAARNSNDQIVVYVMGQDNPHTRVELHVVGNDVNEVISTHLFVPGDPSNTDAAVQMNEIADPPYAEATTFNGYVHYINEHSEYTIYRFIFDI